MPPNAPACPYCREPLAGRTNDCPGCGAPPSATAAAWLAPQSTPQATPQAVIPAVPISGPPVPSPPQAPPSPAPTKRGLGTAGIIAVAAIVAVASGAGVWAVMSASGGSDAPPDEIAQPVPASPSEQSTRAATAPTPASASEGELTARQAASLAEGEAEATLTETRTRDAAILADLPSGVWFPQVSSKCAPLTAADLGDSTGVEPFTVSRNGVAQQYPSGFGYPDGAAEQYPGGIGSPIVLAYHQAMRERFGTSTVLALPTDVGSRTVPDVCQGEPIWISIWTGEAFSTADAALAWCDEQLLVVDECAARLFAPNGESDFELRGS